MKKVVYVTGCLGFIGSYVTRECLKKGWHVRGIDIETYASNPNLLEEFYKYPNFIFEETDINDIEFLYECDYIINTAAETQVYGDITDGEHIETDILKPSNPYSATKAAADQLITAWGRTYNIPYVILRPTNNYGVGQYVEKLIPKSVKYLQLEKRIPLHNEGTPIRNWLHAQDTANAVIKIIESKVQNEIYNICGGFEQTNLDTVTKIITLYHPKDEVLSETFPHYDQRRINQYLDLDIVRKGQDVRYALNDDKLRSLGWEPQMDFDSELPKIVEYYKQNFIW